MVNAVSAQNLILPAGTARIGQFEYDVDLNTARSREGAERSAYQGVGTIRRFTFATSPGSDGFAPQTNIVRAGRRAWRADDDSEEWRRFHLDIVQAVLDALPGSEQTLPPSIKIEPVADQSIFVRAAISGVVREAVIAACLTGIMILVFLGSWRSTIIIAVSIPLSILVSICCLSAIHQTINIMTLGGLALAVGILVDDATVEIENVNGT